MQLKKRYERAMENLRSKRRPGTEMPEDGYPTEKGDFLAMVIAAFLVFMPVAIVVLIVISLVGMARFLF